MTREEEINNASYAYWVNNYANIEFIDEEEKELHTQDIQESFINGAEWADQHPHWISVKEELPKIGKDVLVLREDGEMQVAHQYNEAIARWWSVDGFPLKNNVTHWMPLPKMPVLSNLENTGQDLEGGDNG